jgi:hypothetical protein
VLSLADVERPAFAHGWLADIHTFVGALGTSARVIVTGLKAVNRFGAQAPAA